ncbi:MAG TPA: carbohydrate ABC transporter permease [Anaerolineales bacterium]|nr:carbohydrate ABC transporter permease [Anaerolineales bacterium]
MTNASSQKLVRSILVNAALAVIVILWLVPVIGVFVSSFRQRFDIQTTPWWSVFPHHDWVMTKTINPRELGLDSNGPMTVEGITATFDQLRTGVEEGNKRLIWVGTRPIGKIQVQEKQWVTTTNVSLDNYRQVLQGRSVEIRDASGKRQTVRGDDFSGALLNSLTVAVPSTVIPILIAAFAAYGFAWMRFAGKRFWFTLVVALLVVPLQIALVPVLRDFAGLHLNGTFLGIWMAHTGFGLPLATYLLYNYIRGLPRDILESAFIDGASHFTIFQRLVLPLSLPALASFAIFQFLWVWNDYLVALIILGPDPNVRVVTMKLASIVGDRGQDWYLLTAGAFLSMIVPLIVFFSLQRYFVRGLLAGSVKG